MKRQKLKINGHKIVYRTTGSPQNPTLIMIHGWSSHLGIWDKIVKEFQTDHYCITLDLLGFGNSDKPHMGDYSIRGQAELVLKLADYLGIESFTLVGHSMGGQISFLIASELAPQRVERIVAISSLVAARLSPWVEAVVLPMSRVGFYMPEIYSIFRLLSHYRWFIPLEYRAWFYDWRRLKFDDWAIERYMTNQPNIHIGNYKAGKEMYKVDLRPQLHHVNVPTLNIFGKQDNLVPTYNGEAIAEKVPHCQTVWIEECGHFPMLEQPAELLGAVKKFLRP